MAPDGTFAGNAPAGLAKLGLWTDGTRRILEHLGATTALVAHVPYVHRYPYDWRTKKPVILRCVLCAGREVVGGGAGRGEPRVRCGRTALTEGSSPRPHPMGMGRMRRRRTRATAQWFCNLSALAPQAAAELAKVHMTPPQGMWAGMGRGAGVCGLRRRGTGPRGGGVAEPAWMRCQDGVWWGGR